EINALDDPVAALAIKDSLLGNVVNQTVELFGAERKTFAGAVLQASSARRAALWRERVGKINWELFDRGVEAYTWLALEELAKGAGNIALLSGAQHGAETEHFSREAVKAQLGGVHDSAAFEPFSRLREELEKPFAARIFLWPRVSGPKGDLVDDEMGRVLQVPGWTNIFTQPIINRIEMLSTGVRTDIGVKVFGPDQGTIDRVCKDIETALKPVNGARDVVAAPVMGKGYLEITVDLEKASRYGISIEDVQNEIEIALS